MQKRLNEMKIDPCLDNTKLILTTSTCALYNM